MIVRENTGVVFNLFRFSVGEDGQICQQGLHDPSRPRVCQAYLHRLEGAHGHAWEREEFHYSIENAAADEMRLSRNKVRGRTRYYRGKIIKRARELLRVF